MPSNDHAIVLFDGVCNFCNAAINWVIRNDNRGYFRFAPLQSQAGERLQKKYGFDPSNHETFILIEDGKSHDRSTAALRMVRRLGGLYALAYALIVVPRPLRDFVYTLISRRRYRLFGRRDECMVPTPDVRERFLTE